MADEQAVKPEGEVAPQGEAKSDKKKKINKLSLKEIESRIENLTKVNQVQSRYFKQLIQRKEELQSPGHKISA